MRFTDHERLSNLKELEAARERLCSLTDGLSDAQWQFHPSETSWSVAEVVEHLVLVERIFLPQVLAGMAGPMAPSGVIEKIAGKEALIRKHTSDRRHKVVTPSAYLPSGRWEGATRLLQDFDEVRGRTMAFVSSTTEAIHSKVVRHPVLGDMDGHHWMIFFAGHCARHIAQIEEILEQSHSPARA